MTSRFVKSKATEAHVVHVPIAEQPSYDRAMNTAAVAVHEAAEAIAETVRHTGYYKRKLKRRGNRVIAGDPFWHLVEYGSVHNPPYAPLRRGVLAVGLRLDETPPM